MNIILVDDEAAMIQILKKVIHWEALGIKNVYTAMNVEEAKKLFQEKEIDIALCDIEMPKESGLELIQWVQGLYPGILSIILTGHADFNYARSAISLGVYEFLLKPVSFEELENTLREAVEKIETDLIGSEAEIQESTDKRQRMAETVKKYLKEHYNEVITRNDIEKLVNFNRDHINREFKEITGYTLMEYIQYYRVVMAKNLLKNTKVTVAEISTRIGYDSPAYFTKIFKKRTGMTPVQYRMSTEGEND